MYFDIYGCCKVLSVGKRSQLIPGRALRFHSMLAYSSYSINAKRKLRCSIASTQPSMNNKLSQRLGRLATASRLLTLENWSNSNRFRSSCVAGRRFFSGAITSPIQYTINRTCDGNRKRSFTGNIPRQMCSTPGQCEESPNLIDKDEKQKSRREIEDEIIMAAVKKYLKSDSVDIDTPHTSVDDILDEGNSLSNEPDILDLVRKEIAENSKVLVYAFSTCNKCRDALRVLTAASVPVEVKLLDEGENPIPKQGALLQITGQTTVPIIYVANAYVGGYADMIEKLNDGKDTFVKLLERHQIYHAFKEYEHPFKENEPEQ